MKICNVRILTPEGHFKEGTVFIKGDLISGVVYEDTVQKDIAQRYTAQPDTVSLDGRGAYLMPGMIDLHFHGCMGYDFCDGTQEALHRIAQYEASIGVTAICPATMTLSVDELKQILRNAALFAADRHTCGESRPCAARPGERFPVGSEEGKPCAARPGEQLSVGSEEGKPCAAQLGEQLSGRQQEQLLQGAGYKGQIREMEADFLGINMEGPFISPIKRGAQDESKIIPRSSTVFAQLQEAADGLVRFIAIAPEEPGDEPVDEFIAKVREQYPQTSISLAHTNADYSQAMGAFDAGANHAVHLFNAMPAFAHRAPGVVGAVSDSKQVMAEMICDGVHIHPAVVRAAFKMLGKDRIILISDSMRAAGMPDGRYTLGGLDVNVHGKYATMVRDGALAGSVTPLPDCVRTLVREMGIPLEIAATCATKNPARSLGPDIESKYGTIEPGKRADLILWDENLELKAVIKDGELR